MEDLHIVLDPDKEVYDKNESVTVTVNERNINGGYLGLFKQDGTEAVTSQKTSAKKRTYVFHFACVNTYGEYQFQYSEKHGGKREIIHISKKIHVGPIIQMNASLEENKIKVEYKQESGDSLQSGWVGMYKSNHENNWSYLCYKNIREFNQGVARFDCPVNGQYVFKLFPRNGWSDKYVDAQSVGITINNIDSVKVNVVDGNMVINVCAGSEPCSNMMVTINHLNDRNLSNYYCYENVKCNGTSTIIMPILKHKAGKALRANYCAHLCTKQYDPRACKSFVI